MSSPDPAPFTAEEMNEAFRQLERLSLQDLAVDLQKAAALRSLLLANPKPFDGTYPLPPGDRTAGYKAPSSYHPSQETP